MGLLVLALAGAALTMGQAQPGREVIAQRYSLVNSKGESVGVRAPDRLELPYLYLSGSGDDSDWSSIELRIAQSSISVSESGGSIGASESFPRAPNSLFGPVFDDPPEI